MIKAEWGTKRSCPKCGTRFYDLGKDDPITCIECGESWEDDPVLKSKQPLPFEEAKADPKASDKAADLDDDLTVDVDDEEASADNDVDLGGDDDLGVEQEKKENTDDN